jgi:uncharacterized membrane protein
MMQQRPKIKLQPDPIDKAFEIIAGVGLLAIWVVTLTTYSNLPDTIPSHYNASGQPDGFGPKTKIFSLPIIATVIFIGLTIVNMYPHVFNYPTAITETNASKQYANATRMIRYLKVVTLVVFGMITMKTIQTANGESSGLGTWFLPLTLALFLIPIAFFVIKSLRIKS